MEKRIFIKRIPKGWIVLSQHGRRLSGTYGSPNQALEIARPLAAAQGADIVIYPSQESFTARRRIKNMQK
jgi:hypothetical protein